MRKLWAVIRREFVERVRSKWFWVGAIVGPLFLGAMVVIPILSMGTGGTKRVVVVDGTTGGFGARVADSLARTRAFAVVTREAPRPGVLDSLRREVRAERLDGFLIVTDTTLETGVAEYDAASISFRHNEALRGVLGRLAVNARLERAGVDPRLVNQAQLRIDLRTPKVSRRATGESSAQSFGLAYGMAVVLFIVITIWGVNVMSSVVEEKTTRVVEVLISSLRPFQLMLGKVVGVGAVSLFQLLIWFAGGAYLMGRAGALLARLDVPPDAAQQAPMQLPVVTLGAVAMFVTYFLGGFFLYSAMFAAVGAMSSNEQEARQAQQPVMMLMLVAYLSMFALAGNPGSGYAIALSLIPFTAPIAMPVRWAAGNLPAWEIALSIVLLLLGIVAVTWVAARIYRVGILMTGKRPSLKELVRWVSAS